MKRIKLSINKQYTDGRKYDHFFDEGYLEPDCNSLATKDLTSYLLIKHINFQNGEIEINNGGVIQSGVPYEIKESFMVTTICCDMEDDDVPCNEDTLYLNVKCTNSVNQKKQTISLPYNKGAYVKMEPHPYEVTILDTNNEEVTVEIKDDKKTTTHLVQLYNGVSRSDEFWYATGNPNDPADQAGPVIYLTLMRK